MRSVAILVAFLCSTVQVHAQTPACQSLAKEKRAEAQAILSAQHPYACCDDTILECLQEKPVCRLTRRLADDVCTRVAAGQDRASIERALAKRAASMAHLDKPVVIDLRNTTPAGVPGSKVTASLYLCGRCPFCSRLVPPLHAAVTQGPLKGKVQLRVKVFPIRGHAHSTEAGMAMMAAQKMGKFWPFLLALYGDFDRFDLSGLPKLAAAQGMDAAAFTALMQDPKVRESLVEDKKEGIRNHVDATPTVFINGYRYQGDLTLQALTDVLEEEHDRVSGREYE